MLGSSLAATSFLVVNPMPAESYDPEKIWLVQGILMVIAAVPALVFNLRCKLDEVTPAQGRPLSRWS